MPIAIIALLRLGPRKAASAIARIRNGIASIASVMRDQRIDQAAAIAGQQPDRHPDAERHATETAPAISEARAPQITRPSTSRPISSVPNQCSAEGALRTSVQLVAIGS